MNEYIEQTATNADGIAEVEKIKTPFAKILIGGTFEKPYCHIIWRDLKSGEFNIGYSSSCLEYVRKWLSECFEIVEDDAADVVEVKRGRWEVVHGVITPGGDPLLRCPFCQSRESEHLCGVERYIKWDFCPNCGADMREVDNEGNNS